MDSPSPRIERTRQRLLSAAFDLFSLKGYQATTTKEIASQAGVSEVTLFRHFGSKENLFSAVIETRYRARVLDLNAVRGPSGRRQEELLRAARVLLRNFQENSALFRVMLAEAHRGGVASRAWCRAADAVRGDVAAYLGETLQPVASQVPVLLAAQAFIGMLLAWVIERDIMGSDSLLAFGPEDAAAAFVRVFMEGVGPPGLAPASAAKV